MSFLETFESSLPEHLQKHLQGPGTPFAIQEYPDSMPYIGEERDRSPLNVMLDRQSTAWMAASWPP